MFAAWTVEFKGVEPSLFIPVKRRQLKRHAPTLRTTIVLVLLSFGTFFAVNRLALTAFRRLVNHLQTNTAVKVFILTVLGDKARC